MKKTLIGLCMLWYSGTMAQVANLESVTLVTPKLGQGKAFETAWKAHLGRFHTTGADRQIDTYEIVSGPRSGSFYFVENNKTWADMDKERSTDAKHGQDFETTVMPSLADIGPDEFYRFIDSLSYNKREDITKFTVTYYHLHPGQMVVFTDEVNKTVAVNKAINSPVTFFTHVRQLAGTRPVVVIVSALKDGFKQLETDYFKGNSDRFKAKYKEMYGESLWDRRMDLLPEITELVETELIKHRKDLSADK